MLTSLQALLRLAAQRWFGAFICALAMLLSATSTASAHERVQTKTRVRVFELTRPTLIGAPQLASLERYRGFSRLQLRPCLRPAPLWSWPGNNPFRWRDPYGRYGWEDFGNDFYKHSEAAIDVSLSISVAAGTIATGGLLAEALGLGTLEAGLATVTAEAVGASSALLARGSAVVTASAAMVGKACSGEGPEIEGAAARALPQAERLRMFFDRLQLAKPAENANKALDLLSRTLNSVEDAHSGVAGVTNPGLQYAGRMYPPQADFITQAADGSMQALTKGQQIIFGANGSIGIFSRATGEQIFFKGGQ